MKTTFPQPPYSEVWPWTMFRPTGSEQKEYVQLPGWDRKGKGKGILSFPPSFPFLLTELWTWRWGLSWARWMRATPQG